MNEAQLLQAEGKKAGVLVRRLQAVYGLDLQTLFNSGNDRAVIVKSLVLGLLRIFPSDIRTTIVHHG